MFDKFLHKAAHEDSGYDGNKMPLTAGRQAVMMSIERGVAGSG